MRQANRKLSRSLLLVTAVFLLAFGQWQTLHADQTKRYPLTGTVVSVDVSHYRLTVDMEAIPGYMDAMTMPYKVPDNSVLKTLKKGQRIRATVVVQGDDEHLENITVVPSPQTKSPQ